MQDDQNAPPKKKRKMRDEGKSMASVDDVIPDPFLVDVAKLDLSFLEQAGKKFRQFRFCVVFCWVFGVFSSANV